MSGPLAIAPATVCAVVLAGGRGVRMGGADKGLQTLHGHPLVWHALQRLQAQVGTAPGLIAINANRNLAQYAQWGHPVWPDATPDFAGPLAGFEAALTQALHPAGAHRPPYAYLLVVPCDSPLFPLNLLQRLAHALQHAHADIAVVSVAENHTTALRSQPVFCLLRTTLLTSLQNYMAAGGRKIDTWMRQHRLVEVPFNTPADKPWHFFNANTLAQLQALHSAAHLATDA